MPQEGFAPISDRIKYYRNLLRLSQAFVASQLQIGRSTYTKIESGDLEFSASHLKALANLFKVKIEDFFLPLRADNIDIAPIKNHAQFRLTSQDFRNHDVECQTTVSQCINDLLKWANDESNQGELVRRQRQARQTYAKFKNVNEAIQHCRTLTEKYSVGNAIDVIHLAMEEFGAWVSWNSFGTFSGIYLKMGTEIAKDFELPLPMIGIHSGHPSERQRFSAAHELGHHLLGQKGKIGSPTKPVSDPDEKEANHFAAELLMNPEQVMKIFNEVIHFHESKLDLPSIVLLTANHLQVSYSALVNKLFTLAAIPFEKKEEVLQAKVRELQEKLSKSQKFQSFNKELVQKAEGVLKKTKFYRFDSKTGSPLRTEDIRFIQDYSYVEYLHSCKLKAPLDSSLIFQFVVEDIASRYPNYVSAA